MEFDAWKMECSAEVSALDDCDDDSPETSGSANTDVSSSVIEVGSCDAYV